MKRAVLVLALFLLAFSAYALDVPPPPSLRVNDYAGVLSIEERRSLDAMLAAHERATTNQIVIAIFPSLEGESLEDFSMRLAEAWKIGQAGKDNGVIISVFMQDRKIRIEVGYGLEDALPDVLCKRIIDEEITPRFREQDYAGGLKAAVARIIAGQPGERAASERVLAEYRSAQLGMKLALSLCFLCYAILNWRLYRAKPLWGGFAPTRPWAIAGVLLLIVACYMHIGVMVIATFVTLAYQILLLDSFDTTTMRPYEYAIGLLLSFMVGMFMAPFLAAPFLVLAFLFSLVGRSLPPYLSAIALCASGVALLVYRRRLYALVAKLDVRIAALIEDRRNRRAKGSSGDGRETYYSGSSYSGGSSSGSSFSGGGGSFGGGGASGRW